MPTLSKEVQFTPGPWEVIRVGWASEFVVSTAGRTLGDICRVGMSRGLYAFRRAFGVGNGWRKSDRTELNPRKWVAEVFDEPNARLIAAAPEMYRLLRAMSEAPDEQPIGAWRGAIKTALVMVER